MKGRQSLQYQARELPRSIDLNLLDWLRREFLNIQLALKNVHDLEVLTAPPEHPDEGMIRVADGTVWNPGAGKGVYFFNGQSWEKL